MKRMKSFCVLMIIILLFLFLPSCTRRTQDTLSSIENFYHSLDSFSARVAANVELPDRVQEYILDWTYSAGAYNISIAQPDILADIFISGSLSDGLSIGYDDVLLSVDPSGDVLSPLESLNEMFVDWHGGIADEYCFEQCQDINSLCVGYSHILNGREFRQRIWFDPDSCLPKYAEIYSDNAMIVTFDFLLFSAQ